MIKYLIRKHFAIKKNYKITLSYLDKFTTNQEINFTLSQINQINVLRVNKSTKKNYCHVEITSELEYDEIKIKLENFKVFGNKVKLRLKQLEKFDPLFEEESEETHDITTPIGLKHEILSFFKKNFLNFVGCKEIIDHFNDFDYNRNYLVKDCETSFLEYEYKFVSNENQKMLRIEKTKSSCIINTPKFSIIPLKTFFSHRKPDDKSMEPEENFSDIKESCQNIFLSTINILNKVDLSIYDDKKHIGVWRTLHFKILNKKIMIILMLSQMMLDKYDFKYLKEIMKAEFMNIPNVESIYIAINDKSKATTNNSTFYIYTGSKPYLSEKLVEKNLEINILPSFSNLNKYFNVVDLRECFDITNTIFENVYDYSSDFFPQSIFFKNFRCRKLICPQTTFQKEIQKIKTDNINESQSFDIMSLNIIDKQHLPCFESLLLKEEELEIKNSDENLVVINLRLIDKIELSQKIRYCKYHAIYSESPYQILDFMKRYKERRIQIVKIIFLKNEEFEVKEYLFLIKILN